MGGHLRAGWVVTWEKDGKCFFFPPFFFFNAKADARMGATQGAHWFSWKGVGWEPGICEPAVN